MTTTPNYDAAAIKATETLIKHQVCAAPVDPLPMIRKIPGVIIVSFAELSSRIGIERENLVTMFGDRNQDAVTIVKPKNGVLEYIITYNQKLPYYIMQRAFARELGHIVLQHDGTKPEDVRTEEARCFARHLICPRPLLKAIESEGIPLTFDLIGSITGCYKRCVEEMQRTPGARVPRELNQLVKEQFAGYIKNFISYAKTVYADDHSGVADFGMYMDNYIE